MSRLIDVFSSLDHELERTRAEVDSEVAETFLFREQHEADILVRERREREILRCLMLVNEKRRRRDGYDVFEQKREGRSAVELRHRSVSNLQRVAARLGRRQLLRDNR